MDITTTSAWSALQSVPRPAHLRTLFAEDSLRSARYHLQAGDLMIDYSKHMIDDDVLRRLLAVTAAAGSVIITGTVIEQLFASVTVNV